MTVAPAAVDAVVFDLDGTLVDTVTVASAVYAETVRALGGPVLTPDDVAAVWHVGPTPVLLARLLGRPVTPTDLECYFDRFDAAFHDVCPFPGVAEMLDTLATAHVPVGIFTTATARAAARLTTAAGLAGRVAIVVGGDDVRRPKPAPDGLQLACTRLGCVPARAAYVGDEQVDLDCAAAAGATGVYAAWGTALVAPVGALVARDPGDVPRLLARS